MTKNILITGGSGFVGRNVIDTLFISLPNSHIYNFDKNKHPDERITHIDGDALNFDFTKFSLSFDYIIHLLAIPHNAYCIDFEYAKKINTDFTYKLLLFASRQKKLKKFIHMSSTILYDPCVHSPVSENSPLLFSRTPYGYTKGLAEQHALFFLHHLSIPIVIFRLSNIYGAYQYVDNSPFLIPSKIEQALSTNIITVFDSITRKDWIFAADAADAVVQALSHTYNGILNLASGESHSVGDVMHLLAQGTGACFQEETQNSSTLPSQNFFCDIHKITKEFSWRPKTSIKEGISSTLKSIQENGTSV